MILEKETLLSSHEENGNLFPALDMTSTFPSGVHSHSRSAQILRHSIWMVTEYVNFGIFGIYGLLPAK